MTTEANALLSAHGDAQIWAWAEDLHEHLVEMRTKVEEKLEGVDS